MRQQNLHRGGRNAAQLSARILGKASEKKIGEIGNIFLALAQRRNVDGHDVEAVIKVLAEGSLLQRGAQIAIGGGEQADINLDGARAAQALKFALLEHAQKLDLRDGRNVANLVEE